jgi:hypothetical protein
MALVMNVASALAMNHFTLHTYKSPTGVNWSTPKNLAKSVVLNEIFAGPTNNKLILGHITIDLKCGDKHIVTGMSARPGETRNTVLKKHAGLGVLLHVFPGYLESPEEISSEILRKQNDGSMHSIRYLLNDNQCQQMLDHYENFKAQGGMHNYGFPLDTLKGQGAGCSAFGVSFLQAANLTTQTHLSAWSGSVWIPAKYIGPYNDQLYYSENQPTFPNTQGGKPVKLQNMILNPIRSSWAKPVEADAHYLKFFDPDQMFRWVVSMQKKWHPRADYKIRKINRSIELIFDYR